MPRVTTAREVGALVRHHRTAANLTLEDLAARSGISRRTLLNIEAGHAGVRVGSVLSVLATLGVMLTSAESLSVDGPDLDDVLSRYDAGHP